MAHTVKKFSQKEVYHMVMLLYICHISKGVITKMCREGGMYSMLLGIEIRPKRVVLEKIHITSKLFKLS